VLRAGRTRAPLTRCLLSRRQTEIIAFSDRVAEFKAIDTEARRRGAASRPTGQSPAFRRAS
jgi:hypothetical protein